MVEQDKDTNWKVVMEEAYRRARFAVMRASSEYKETGVRHNGFAYVIVKSHRPSSFFSRWCIKNGVGVYNETKKELSWLNPGKYSGRNVRVHRAGAEAFAEFLGRFGVVSSIHDSSIRKVQKPRKTPIGKISKIPKK